MAELDITLANKFNTASVMQLLPFAAVNYQILKSWEIAVVSLKIPFFQKMNLLNSHEISRNEIL
jgi:hypothetical protein